MGSRFPRHGSAVSSKNILLKQFFVDNSIDKKGRNIENCEKTWKSTRSSDSLMHKFQL